jgi:hypothetical protein
MAKRKTGKVKDFRPTKITKEQLEKLQNTAKSMDQMQLELGVLETRKHSILHMVANAQNLLKGLEDEFIKEYGTADVNIVDGTIKYTENANFEAN